MPRYLRYPAKVNRHLQLRLKYVSKAIQDINWKAQVRLCKRYRRLVARGKNVNQVVVASAREGGFCLGHCPRGRRGLLRLPSREIGLSVNKL